MSQVKFSGLYKAQFQQSNNKYLSQGATLQPMRDAITELQSKNNNQTAKAFFVHYPPSKQRIESAKTAAKWGAVYIHFPKPGQDYDVYVATNDETEKTADALAAKQAKRAPSCFGKVLKPFKKSNPKPEEQFVQDYQGNIGTLNIALDPDQKLKNWNIIA